MESQRLRRHALRLAWHHQAFFWAVATLGVINLAWSAAFTVGVPLWTSRVLHGDAGAYGVIVGAYGAGNVVSLWLASGTRRWPLRAMYLGKVAQGIGFVLLALSPTLAVAVLGSCVAALGGGLGDLTLLTMMQTEFPPEHIGKIYSLRAMIGGGGLLLGLVVAAPLFALWSVPVGITVCGWAIVLTGACGLRRFWGCERSSIVTSS